MDGLAVVFQIIVLVLSAVVHEVSHGLMAEKLGDPTARNAGRLTLNPLKHLDPYGSFLLPVLLILSGSPVVLGWAKPVPFDPRNLKNPAKGAALIALAGPLSNIALAVLMAVFYRVASALSGGDTTAPLFVLIEIAIYINIALAIFNLVPIPPLDGSKLLYPVFPNIRPEVMGFLERYGILLVLAFLLFGGDMILGPLIHGTFLFLVGS